MKDRLARKVEDKARHQLHGKHGLLVVYDRLSTPDQMKQWFDEREIELVIGTFKNLAGVILVFSSARIIEPPSDSHETREGRVFIQHRLPDGAWEAAVAWGNIMANHKTILGAVIGSIMEFPVNLKRLFDSAQPRKD